MRATAAESIAALRLSISLHTPVRTQAPILSGGSGLRPGPGVPPARAHARVRLQEEDTVASKACQRDFMAESLRAAPRHVRSGAASHEADGTSIEPPSPGAPFHRLT